MLAVTPERNEDEEIQLLTLDITDVTVNIVPPSPAPEGS
jgi:hypothetical protein